MPASSWTGLVFRTVRDKLIFIMSYPISGGGGGVFYNSTKRLKYRKPIRFEARTVCSFYTTQSSDPGVYHSPPQSQLLATPDS